MAYITMEASSRQRRQAAIDEYLILLILTINNGRITIASMIFFILGRVEHWV
jgi:hypothetical protein